MVSTFCTEIDGFWMEGSRIAYTRVILGQGGQRGRQAECRDRDQHRLVVAIKHRLWKTLTVFDESL